MASFPGSGERSCYPCVGDATAGQWENGVRPSVDSPTPNVSSPTQPCRPESMGFDWRERSIAGASNLSGRNLRGSFFRINAITMVICEEHPAIPAKTGASEIYFIALVLLHRGVQMETMGLGYLIELERIPLASREEVALSAPSVIRNS